MSTVVDRWQSVMMDNYGTPPIALASGQGAVVTDVDGKTYLDLLAGIAVNVLGHRHPAIIEAVTAQLNTLGHVSNLYATEPGVALAVLGPDGAGKTTLVEGLRDEIPLAVSVRYLGVFRANPQEPLWQRVPGVGLGVKLATLRWRSAKAGLQTG